MTDASDYKYLFLAAVQQKASDLFIKVGAAPAIRVAGKIKTLEGPGVSKEMVQKIHDDILGQDELLLKKFKEQGEIDSAFEIVGIGRFRVNIYKQRGLLGFVFRCVKKNIPNLDDLKLPTAPLQKLMDLKRGLVLVTGSAGNGKSTTIASMINYVNHNQHRHIITVEDPIEYIFVDDKSIIDQREVGADTHSFTSALKYSLRQSPDIIMIGEMRDLETMETAINAAETGHLVISTLHTINASQTVERIVNIFPPHQQQLLREQLALLLEGVISIRLIPAKDGKGMIPAVEIMLATPSIKELLHTGKTRELYNAIRDGSYYGNQTFNQCLKSLYTSNVITEETALASADRPDELKLELRGISKLASSSDFRFKASDILKPKLKK